MVFFYSNLNCIKQVSPIDKFDSTKWNLWIKLFSVNSGWVWSEWDLLKVAESNMLLLSEYCNSKSYFWRRRKNFWIQGGQEIIDLLKFDFNNLRSLIAINL